MMFCELHGWAGKILISSNINRVVIGLSKPENMNQVHSIEWTDELTLGDSMTPIKLSNGPPQSKRKHVFFHSMIIYANPVRLTLQMW